MKKGLLIALTLLVVPLQAHAVERIMAYRTDITVDRDSVLLVEESIAYDFGTETKHGIFRDIPRSSSDGPRTTISHVAVKMDGNAVPVTVDAGRDQVHVRIGDPDRTVSGLHTYFITYSVSDAVRYFDNRDEVFWNSIPQNFPVPIEKAETTIVFPSGTRIIGEPSCYTGSSGSTTQDCDVSTSGGTVRAVARQTFASNEGMTVAAAIAPGSITRVAPQPDESGGSVLWAIVLFAAVMALVVGLFVVWMRNRLHLPKHRRDGGDIVVQYDAPQGVTPAEAAYLATNGADKNSITATIIQLAISGWLKLEFTEKKRWLFTSRDIIFHRRRDGIPEDSFAAQLMEIFAPTSEPQKLSDVTTAVRKREVKLHETTATIAEELLSRGLLKKRGFWMHVATEEGRDAMEHLAGLKIYLTMAEKRRLEFHNAPEHNPQTFEKLLPYAIALGVDEPWREAFADVLTTPPDWASGNGNFTGAMVGLSQLSSGVNSLVGAYSSGTSGSGFSGGGGGGGGGGSW